jgi:hypothetical protein
MAANRFILNTGNVGIDIPSPANIFNVGPEFRFDGNKTSIGATSPDGTIILLNIDLFTGMNLEQKKMFIGGSLIVENYNYTRCTIVNVELDNNIQYSNRLLYVNSNLSAYVNSTVTIHYAGLNVVKYAGTYDSPQNNVNSGFIGVKTPTPGSVLGVNGSFSLPIITTDGDINPLDCTHYTVICDTTINNNHITITLPSNNTKITGRIYVLKYIGNGIKFLYINPNGCNIDNQPGNYSINTQYKSIHIQSDGTNWWLI